MKAIMLSVQPQWVAKILNGEKTIEIRKTMPKCDLPIDVYLYCTKSKIKLFFDNIYRRFMYGIDNKRDKFNSLNGKVVAKFTLNKYTDMMKWAYSYKDNEFYELLKKACIDTYDLTNYAGNKAKRLYAWEIDNLVIFDTPKELKEFTPQEIPKNALIEKDQYGQEYYYIPNNMAWHIYFNRVIKAPQSWQFIEVEK